MKKFIALLLVAIMAITAVIPAMAAGNTDETAPDAPVFVGAQTRDSETENSSDVRFIATVSSTTGTCVGYEIVANYYEVGATEPAKTVTYTGEETESTTVYTSVLEKGKTEATKAEDLTPGATGIFVVTLIGVPNGQSVDFTITAYVKYNGEDIPSTTKFQRYENGEIMVVNTVYSQDFSTNNLTKLQEAGITPVLSGNPYISVRNGKLNLSDLAWANCFLSAADYNDVATAVGSHSAYMVQMDLSFDYINGFSLILNGDCGTDSYKTLMANGIIVQIRAASSDTATPSKKDIVEGLNIYARTRFLDSTGSNAPSGNLDVETTAYGNYSDDIKAFTVGEDETTADFKLTVVLNKLTSGTRLDLFIDTTHIASYTSESECWLKENKNPIVLWAENNIVTMDNLKVVGINTQNDGTTIPTDLDVTNQYLQIFDDYECESPYRTYISENCNVGSWLAYNANGNLTVNYHGNGTNQHSLTNPDWSATLVAPGKISDGQTYYVEMDISNIASWGSEFGIKIVNNDTISDSTDLHKNGCFIRLMRNGSTKYISGTIQVTNYDADGVAVTYGENTYRETTVSDIASSSNVQAVKLGIMVDSTLANGTLISIYANDVFVESFYMEGNAYDATSNTSIALWAENTTLKLDNITLKTYTAPIAA